jgi:hypothetical protein|tara:strand:+ start:1277 stop:1693 length:417 start_codon:yes stop_codon:yes gene_type:complete
MDPIKALRKFKYDQKEIQDATKEQLDSLTKPIPNKEEYERVMNLKDLMLRQLKLNGFLTEENKGYFLIAVYQSIINEYWDQIDLPKEKRAIYYASRTDKELKKDQLKYYKSLQKKARDYKKIMNDWWKQRADEEEFLK